MLIDNTDVIVCDMCGKKESIYYVVETKNGWITIESSLHIIDLCPECSKKEKENGNIV